jgi:hypothetical protein
MNRQDAQLIEQTEDRFGLNALLPQCGNRFFPIVPESCSWPILLQNYFRPSQLTTRQRAARILIHKSNQYRNTIPEFLRD